jgi:microcystin-dependent protein
MSYPYISEIRIMSFGFAPRGWLQCNGQLLPIQQYQALFSLIGTYYGGDGIRTFALPDLRGRAALHFGQGEFGDAYEIGERAGEATHTLTVTETPMHNHPLMAVAAAADPAPGGVTPAPTVALAQAAAYEGAGKPTIPVSMYSTAAANSTLAANALSSVGGQSHENRQPFLALNFCISMQGIFPTRG